MDSRWAARHLVGARPRGASSRCGRRRSLRRRARPGALPQGDDRRPAGAARSSMSRPRWSWPCATWRSNSLRNEAAHVAHAIEVDAAVEVVALVLDHAGEEALGLQHVGLALAVEGLEPQPRVARHLPAQVGDGEAALPAVDRLRHRSGVTSGFTRTVKGTPPSGAVVGRRHLDHGEAQAHVDLGRGEAHPVVLVHRLDHVVDEALHARESGAPRGTPSRAGPRTTGCPMRATFRIDIPTCRTRSGRPPRPPPRGSRTRAGPGGPATRPAPSATSRGTARAARRPARRPRRGRGRRA